jgi:P pilus assembly chaperone PapD
VSVRPPKNPLGGLVRLAVQVGLSLGVSLGGAQSLAAQIGVDQLEMHIRLEDPRSLTQAIPVRSEATESQQVRVTVKGWYRDSTGSNQYVPYDSLDSSCNEKLQVFPATLQVGARSTEFVRVTYAPSGPADAGCWAIVFVEVVRPPSTRSETDGAALEINVVTGVKVYVHPATSTAEGEVLSADVEEFREARATPPTTPVDSALVRQVAVRFENTGTAHLIVKTTLEIRNASTQVVREIAGPDAYLTPRAFRDILVRLPGDLPAGRYVAVALLDYGGTEIRAAQVEFEIP